MKREHVKDFFKRGLAFGGFGPIVAGIVYFILSFAIDDFSLSGGEVFLAIISTYILAFIQAGASVFNQIESWGVAKSLFCHLGLIYISYVLCYVINSWIPFEWIVLLIFTIIFVAVYLVIWLTVYLCIKATSKKFNKKIS